MVRIHEQDTGNILRSDYLVNQSSLSSRECRTAREGRGWGVTPDARGSEANELQNMGGEEEMKIFRRLLLLPALIVALVLAGLPYPFSALLAAQSVGDIPAALTVLNLATAGSSAVPEVSLLERQSIRV